MVTYTLVGWRTANSTKREFFATAKMTAEQANARNKILRAKKMAVRWSSSP